MEMEISDVQIWWSLDSFPKMMELEGSWKVWISWAKNPGRQKQQKHEEVLQQLKTSQKHAETKFCFIYLPAHDKRLLITAWGRNGWCVQHWLPVVYFQAVKHGRHRCIACHPQAIHLHLPVSDWYIRRLRWVVIWVICKLMWIATSLLSSFLGTWCCSKEQEATEVLNMLSVLEDWNLYVVHALEPFSYTSNACKSSTVQRYQWQMIFDHIWPSLTHPEVSFGCNPSRRSSVRRNVSYKRGERICWRWASKIPMKKIRRRASAWVGGRIQRSFSKWFVDLWCLVTKVACFIRLQQTRPSGIVIYAVRSRDKCYQSNNTDNITLRFAVKQLLIHHLEFAIFHRQEFTSLIVCAVGGLFVTTLERGLRYYASSWPSEDCRYVIHRSNSQLTRVNKTCK